MSEVFGDMVIGITLICLFVPDIAHHFISALTKIFGPRK